MKTWDNMHDWYKTWWFKGCLGLALCLAFGKGKENHSLGPWLKRMTRWSSLGKIDHGLDILLDSPLISKYVTIMNKNTIKKRKELKIYFLIIFEGVLSLSTLYLKILVKHSLWMRWEFPLTRVDSRCDM